MPRRSPGRWWLPATGVLLVLAGAVLTASTSNPPGFYRDEAGIALNAATLADSGRDEFGNLLPLYLSSYGDFKSTPYSYLLAVVFAVTGPDELVARAFSAVLGAVAVLLLGLLAARLSGSRVVGAVLAVLAAATPWLFEVSRLVFEVAMLPALVALLLLLLASTRGQETWSRRTCAAVGVTLALIAYAYAGGRALAPLLAVALLVFARGPRRRSVLEVYGWCALALVPLAAYVIRNPRALFVRLGMTDDRGSGPLAVVGNLARELDLVRWVLEGDGNARHHVQGTGSLLAAVALLAVAGVVVLVRARRWDAWWSYVLLATVASAVPAAITDVRLHALRSVALPVCLLVLAVPAVAALVAHARRPVVLAAAAAVSVVALVQAVAFHVHYAQEGPRRTDAFHTGLPTVLRAAQDAGRGPAVMHFDDADAWGGATWYAELWDEPVTVLGPGESPPPGSAVVAVERVCATCQVLAQDGVFVAYVAEP